MCTRFGNLKGLISAIAMAAVIQSGQSALGAPPVIVKDINTIPTGSVVRDSFPANLLQMNGRVYFSVETPGQNRP